MLLGGSRKAIDTIRWPSACGRFDGNEREYLEEVRNDHVPVCASRLVEVDPGLEPQGLGDVDLHVIDEVAIPDRLEDAVREPGREDVLRRFLAEEMVNPEDLALREGLVQPSIESDGTLQIAAERFLHNDLCPLSQTGRPQHVDDCDGGPGRDAEIVQATDVFT